MFKLLRSLISTAFFVVLVVGGALWLFRAPFLSHVISRAIDLPVSLEGVDVGWNRLKLRGLQVGGTTEAATLFESEAVTVEMALSALWQPVVVIDRVIFENPTLFVQVYGHRRSNWSHIVGASTPRKGRKYEVKSVALYNLQCTVGKKRGSPMTVTIPKLVFSPEGPLFFSNVLNRLSKEMLGALSKESGVEVGECSSPEKVEEKKNSFLERLRELVIPV